MRRVLGSRNTRGRGNSRWSEGAHGTQDMRCQRWCDINRFESCSFFLFVWWFFKSVLLSPWHTKVIREEEPQLKKNVYRQMQMCWAFFYDYWFGRAQGILGCAIPGLVVLGWVKKQTQQATGSKSISRVPLWPLLQSGLQFPPWTSSIRNYNLWSQISPFSPRCFTTWSWYLLQQ